jgi:hypothetical protein
MLCRCFGAAVVLLVLGGFVIAETYQGTVTSLTEKEVKITLKGKKGKKGVEKTFKLGKEVKITKKAKNADDEPKALKLDQAIKHVETRVSKSTAKVKGARATIKTTGEGDDEAVSEIAFGGGKNKPKEEE